MRNPIVSVLLPVYNGEHFLKQTIESVLNQTFVDFELIIIDDGSTDSSCKIIQSFEDQRIVFVENSENLRLIKTLNKGLELAKGKYLARIDADDYMHPTRLEKQVYFLDLHNEYVLVGSDVQLVRDSVVVEGDTLKYYSDHDDIVFSMSYYCPFVHSSIMLRMDLIRARQLKFDLAYLHAEDYELWTRIVRYGKVHNINENLTYYRIHSYQISNVHLDFQKKQMKKIQMGFLRLQNLNDQEIKILFNEEYELDLVVFYQSIEKFSKNGSFTGAAKERFILKNVKNYMLEKKTFRFKEWSYILQNTFFRKVNFSFVQYLTFIFKTLKIR